MGLRLQPKQSDSRASSLNWFLCLGQNHHYQQHFSPILLSGHEAIPESNNYLIHSHIKFPTRLCPCWLDSEFSVDSLAHYQQWFFQNFFTVLKLPTICRVTHITIPVRDSSPTLMGKAAQAGTSSAISFLLMDPILLLSRTTLPPFQG